MSDIFQKAARKKTYSRRKPKKKENSLLLSDKEEDDPLELTNVEALLADDGEDLESESEEAKSAPPDLENIVSKKADDTIDPALPPLVDSKDTMEVDPRITAKAEREAIKEARKMVEDEEQKDQEPIRRSRRMKKKTPKMRVQEAAVKSKSKPHATTSRKKKSSSSKSIKSRKADITEVSEGTGIRLFWEPTQTWSNGIVTQDWKDGYFTIEFEDDVKEQGALSYKLAEYDWSILEQDSKSNSKKGRKRKRNKDGDYTDDAAAAPAKKQRYKGEAKNNSALEERIEELTEDKKELKGEIKELKGTIASLEKEKTQYEGEKEEITKVLDTIELKGFKSTNVMEKLKHILNNYKADSEAP